MAAAAAAASAAASYSLSLRCFPPLVLASAPLKRFPLSPGSAVLSASPKSQFSRGLVASRGHRLCIRSMASEGNPQAVEVPRSVPVRVAQELLQAGHRYLDVRTPEEFSAGHAVGAVNVPYMFKVGAGMTKNPKFVEEVSSMFGKDNEIIVGCQSGKRSLMAATDLTSAAYSREATTASPKEGKEEVCGLLCVPSDQSDESGDSCPEQETRRTTRAAALITSPMRGENS